MSSIEYLAIIIFNESETVALSDFSFDSCAFDIIPFSPNTRFMLIPANISSITTVTAKAISVIPFALVFFSCDFPISMFLFCIFFSFITLPPKFFSDIVYH